MEEGGCKQGNLAWGKRKKKVAVDSLGRVWVLCGKREGEFKCRSSGRHWEEQKGKIVVNTELSMDKSKGDKKKRV